MSKYFILMPLIVRVDHGQWNNDIVSLYYKTSKYFFVWRTEYNIALFKIESKWPQSKT